MFNLGKFILFIIWLLDIFNLPFMQCLDNELPINTIAWIIIWILVNTNITIKKNRRETIWINILEYF